jgi:hypothetical protein
MWTDVPDNMAIDNGFKAQWELFLRDAARGRPFAWDLFAGARGVQLAEFAIRSSQEGRRVEVPVPASTPPATTVPSNTVPSNTVPSTTGAGA